MIITLFYLKLKKKIKLLQIKFLDTKVFVSQSISFVVSLAQALYSG